MEKILIIIIPAFILLAMFYVISQIKGEIKRNTDFIGRTSEK
tara:strand:- start:688 stop:813 length:126 start_codon:yes stop_codon:yes gene_type:complete